VELFRPTCVACYIDQVGPGEAGGIHSLPAAPSIKQRRSVKNMESEGVKWICSREE